MKRLFSLLMLLGLLIGSMSDCSFAKTYGGGGGSSAGGHSYGSGGTHSAGGGVSSSGGGRSGYYSSAAKSTPSPNSSSNSWASSAPRAPQQSSSPRAVPKSNFDSGAHTDAHAQSSSEAYQRSVAPPKVTYTSSPRPQAQYVPPSGVSKPIKETDPEVAYLRGRLSGERYANRQAARTSFYNNYHYTYPSSYGRYYAYSYSDPYSNDFIWHWLMFQSIQTQADWVYNHQSQIDQQRLNDMYAQNAALRTQVAVLESGHVPVNPAYQPAGVEPEVVYNDGYVGAVVNPVQTVSYDEPAPYTGPGVSFGHMVWVLVKLVFGLLVIGIIIWVIIAAIHTVNQR